MGVRFKDQHPEIREVCGFMSQLSRSETYGISPYKRKGRSGHCVVYENKCIGSGKSDGLYISVPVGTSVRAVADGEVSSVYDLGGEQAVTVRHGKYFTTYSHLSSVSVGQGQQVNPSTVVGRAAANDTGEGEVLFMVTNERSVFLNPEQWLKRR